MMSDNPEYLGATILVFRMLLNIITAMSLACYMSRSRKRIFPTIVAIVGGGCSLAAFFQGVGEIQNSSYAHTQPWVLGIVFSFAVVCLYSRGNIARPFTRPSRS